MENTGLNVRKGEQGHGQHKKGLSTVADEGLLAKSISKHEFPICSSHK